MSKSAPLVLAFVALVGCGEKAQEAKNTMNALQAVAAASGTMGEAQADAEKFYQERRAKGDTVPIPYAELQKFLPSPPGDYTVTEEPSGSSQSMAGFAMSQVEQTFSKPADANGVAPSIAVTLVDFGGTQAAYGMMALPMMMNLNQEDAHRRYQTLKLGAAHTWGSAEYNKDSKDAKVTIVTRYRYTISVEARNQAEDQSSMVKDLAEDIAKKFADK